MRNIQRKLMRTCGNRKRWLMRQPQVCHYCGISLLPSSRGSWTRKLVPPTVDHAQPVSRGGADEPHNWRACCQHCNKDKGALTEQEYFELRATRIARKSQQQQGVEQ